VLLALPLFTITGSTPAWVRCHHGAPACWCTVSTRPCADIVARRR
jgi:hypothetical protein